MDLRPFEEALERTLDDGRLSRTERRALQLVLEELDSSRARDVLRSRVFEIARGRARDEAERGRLEWLDSVLRLLDPESPPTLARAAAHFSPGDACRSAITRLIGAARESVDVCVFTITDDRISNELSAAHRRRVRVRIVTDDDKSQDLGSDCERLAEYGIPVAVDESEKHMHHKFAIVDRRTVITGSYNWTRSAALENEENIVVTEDPDLVRAFEGEFEALWTRFARP